MEKIIQKIDKFTIIVLLIVFTIGLFAGGIIIYTAYSRTAQRTRQEFSDAERINREITAELQRELDRTKRAVETVENIRGKFKEADSFIGELRLVNRGSSDISKAIREEINILENYFLDTGDELYNYYNNINSEVEQ